MAYDGAVGAVILFGGCSLTSCPTNDTWRFTGGHWANVTSGPAPTARWRAMLGFDPAIGALVLFGGCSNTTCQLNDTWEYRGGNWTNVTSGPAPPGRSEGSLVYDYNDSALYLFGGCVNSPNGSSGIGCADNLLWLFHPNGSWSPVTLTHGSPIPAPRSQAAVASDPSVGGLLLEGGEQFNVTHSVDVGFNDTWSFSNGSWKNLTSGPAPVPCCALAGGWDNATSSVILFSGIASPPSSATYSATWSFSAGTWTNVSPSVSPPARELAAAAYDAADQELLVFGGENASNPALADSWVYRLAAFPSPTASPVSRGVDVGQLVTFSAPPAAVQSNASYLWLQLPGCAAIDVPVLHCLAASFGSFAVSLNVSATGGTSGSSVPLLYTVYSAPAVGTFSTFPPVVDVGQMTNFSGSAAGGTGQYVFNWSSLPPGCASTNSLALPCSPTAAGNFRPHLTVTDSNGVSETGILPPLTVYGALGLNLTVAPSPTYLGTAFAITASISGGTPPTTVAWSALPAGCHQPSNLVVNCTENAVGTVRLALSVRDSSSEQLTRVINVSVVEPPGSRTNGSSVGTNPSFLDEYGLYLGLGVAAVLLLLLALWQRARGRGPPPPAPSRPSWRPMLPPPHSSRPMLPPPEDPEPPTGGSSFG
jgi:hypothetical protein